jgi:hypothetical protein
MMNPNPLAALNHLTVPSAISVSSLRLAAPVHRPRGRAVNRVSIQLESFRWGNAARLAGTSIAPAWAQTPFGKSIPGLSAATPGAATPTLEAQRFAGSQPQDAPHWSVIGSGRLGFIGPITL